MRTAAETIEAIAAMWGEGASAADIGAKLELSRNAVLGQVHRARGRGEAWAKMRVTKVARQMPKRQPRVRVARPDKPPVPATGLVAPVDQARAPVPPALPPAAMDVAWLPLIALTDHTCRWPMGDPLLPGFGFCGAETGGQARYCAAHLVRSRGQPAPARIKTAPAGMTNLRRPLVVPRRKMEVSA